MKMFLIVVSVLCVGGILLSFVAFATGRLPGAPAPQIEIAGTVVETDPLCVPCEEKIASIVEILDEQWEADMTAVIEQMVAPIATAKPSTPKNDNAEN